MKTRTGRNGEGRVKRGGAKLPSLLLCVHPEAVELLLEELHEEICGATQ